MSLLDRKQVLKLTGWSARTLTRRIAEGLPHTKDPDDGRGYAFSSDEVLAWCAERGLAIKQAPTAAPVQKRAAAAKKVAASRDELKEAKAKAAAMQQVTRAKQLEAQFQAEQKLRELGLGAKIRAATSLGDLLDLGLEIAALISEGTLTATRGRALKETLGEARQALKLKLSEDRLAPSDALALVPAPAPAVELAELYMCVISEERRERILAFVRAEAEADELEHPNVDPGEGPLDASEGDYDEG